MTEPTPAAQKHAQARITSLCQWMQDNMPAFAAERGQMVVEWDADRTRVTVELRTEVAKQAISRY